MATVEILPTAVEPLRRTITSSGVPVTGATVRCDVSRISAGVFQILDLSDATFKAPASVVTRYRALPPVDAVNAPGRYAAATSLDVGTIVGGVVSGDLLTVTYYRVSPDYTLDSDSLRVVAAPTTAAAISAQVASDLATAHGAGAWTTASVAGLALESTLTAMKGATFDGSTDSLEAIRNRGDAAWLTGSGWAVAGDAMTLTAPALTAVQAKILDDGTPFHGASIATILAFGAPPNAAANAAAVWATVEGGSVGDMRYALTLLRERQTGRRKMGLDGYELIYGSDNVTVIARVLVKDIDGNIVVPAAGDPSEVSQEVAP